MAAVELEALFGILLERVGDELMEATLLRLLFADQTKGFALEGDGLALMYRLHFSLYNALYRLRPVAAERGFDLQIRPCRVRMEEAPPGRCGFVAQGDGRRCGESAGSAGFCPGHMGEPGPLEEVSMREFYLDEGNMTALNPGDLETMVKGYAGLAFSRDEAGKAYSELGLPFGAPLREIRERFRVLALTAHPDMPGGDHDDFGRINRAYRTLLRIVPENGCLGS